MTVLQDGSLKKFDFIALGRAAVDFYGEQVGGRLEDMTSFAKYLGGCPANISVGAARLGLKPAMLTRVGDEHMGRFVRETLAREGVDVSHVTTDPKRLTGLVVLGIRDRESFPLIFYRENCADMALSEDDFDEAFVASAQALLVTGTHFATAHVDRVSRLAMRYARRNNVKVVLDIDYRPVLWGLTGHGLGEERFIASDTVSQHLQSILPDCDLVVGTEEEIHIAGGAVDTFIALRKIRALTSAIIVVKRGAQGCTIFPDAIPDRFEEAIDCPGLAVDVFNVLGAGDGFMAGLLRGWLRGAGWRQSAAFANACGALVVARHGCAPAMPSWTELQEVLGRGVNSGLHRDQTIAYLHRRTTGITPRAQVLALALDHRKQFEELIGNDHAAARRVGRLKRLILDGLLQLPGWDRTGILLDDRFARNALDAASGQGLWIARPVELPGARPLAFEHGPDITSTLRAWPREHVAKCLALYRADDNDELRAEQERSLLQLQSAAEASGREWLLEIIPPCGPDEDFGQVLRMALVRLYEQGLKPNWWKLPPLARSEDWSAIGDVVRAGDRFCRGILILGLDSEEADLAASFVAARGEPLLRGFAVGRHIFWDAAVRWFEGSASDEEMVHDVMQRFTRLCAIWSTAVAQRELA